LYLQLVLGSTPLQVGLAFLPANVTMGVFSLGLSPKLALRWGSRRRRPASEEQEADMAESPVPVIVDVD
jgi:hypothetical protein